MSDSISDALFLFAPAISRCASPFSPIRPRMESLNWGFNLNVWSAGGMLGAAVGAADHAVFERDPIGAGALEGLATASGSASDAFAPLHFQIEESIDVTGTRW
jgi:hypothetical protein